MKVLDTISFILKFSSVRPELISFLFDLFVSLAKIEIVVETSGLVKFPISNKPGQKGVKY